MTFLTIFTAPKPFTNPHINIIQRNAIQSWLRLGNEVEVIVFGDEEVIAEATNELGARHIPTILRNDQGTPLLSDIFSKAHDHGQGQVLVYANADIIFIPDILRVTQEIQNSLNDYLVVGRRWNLDVTDSLDFSPQWVDHLRSRIAERGELFVPKAIDYFIFPKHLYMDIPPFAVGRPAWDNWMIFEGHNQGYKLIDATRGITAVHQNHDYHHLPDNKPHYFTEEAKQNLILAGGPRNIFNILDTDFEFVEGRIRPVGFSRIRFVRGIERRLQTNQGSGLRWFIASRLKRLQKRWNYQ
jgi:hypothetical protein